MRLKLSQLDKKNILLLVEYHYTFLRLYFADGHSEFKDESIQHYIVKKNTGYKNPIYIYDQWLYPTGDYHQNSCFWIQLDCIEDYNLELISFIEDEQTRLKVRKLYLKHIERKLINLGF